MTELTMPNPLRQEGRRINHGGFADLSKDKFGVDCVL